MKQLTITVTIGDAETKANTQLAQATAQRLNGHGAVASAEAIGNTIKLTVQAPRRSSARGVAKQLARTLAALPGAQDIQVQEGPTAAPPTEPVATLGRLSPIQRKLLAHLASGLELGLHELSRNANCNPNTVRRFANQLASQGLLTIAESPDSVYRKNTLEYKALRYQLNHAGMEVAQAYLGTE
jgi:hypothetical protein